MENYEKYDNYDYEKLTNDLKRLRLEYPELETGSIGKSEQGRDLYYIRLGVGKRAVFYNAAHHALEWITSAILMKFAEDYAKTYRAREKLCGINTRDLFNKVSIYLVLMVNPDGIEIVKSGNLKWQANSRGVDLNHNYDALWEEGKISIAAEHGIDKPGPTRYSGEYPESEAETRAVANFSRSMNFDLAIALHSQGEVIYWTFDNINPPNSFPIGKRLEKASGYALDYTSGAASYSGYKDWFMKEFNKPGYTIEAGLGENPLPISQLDDIYERVCPALTVAAYWGIN